MVWQNSITRMPSSGNGFPFSSLKLTPVINNLFESEVYIGEIQPAPSGSRLLPRFVVAAGKRPLSGTAGWLSGTLPIAGPHHDVGKFIDSADALGAMGVEIEEAKLRLSWNQCRTIK